MKKAQTIKFSKVTNKQKKSIPFALLLAGEPPLMAYDQAFLGRLGLLLIRTLYIESVIDAVSSGTIRLMILENRKIFSIANLFSRLKAAGPRPFPAIIVINEPGRTAAGLPAGILQTQADAPVEEFAQALVGLLGLPSRRSIRYQLRLHVIDSKTADILGESIKISTSGMLLKTYTRLIPGQHLYITLRGIPILRGGSIVGKVLRSEPPPREESLGHYFFSVEFDPIASPLALSRLADFLKAGSSCIDGLRQ